MTTEPIRISNSEMAMFRECRRKWWLTYLRRLAPKRRTLVGPLPLGARLHKALEAHYKGGVDLLDAYRALVDEARTTYLDTDPFPDTEEFDKEAELGRIMLEGYLEWIAEEGIDANLEVLGVEEVLTYLMLDGKVELTGKIDLRVRNRITGMRSTLDFKSAASLGDFDKTGHMQTQLKTYQLLDMLTSPEDKRIEGGIYRIMKKVKRTSKANPPFFAEFPIRHNRTTIENYWKQVNGILREILAVRRGLTEKGGDHQVLAYPSPTRDCSWKCDFYTICPMFDDGSAVESAIADMYVEVDPYAYYSDDAETGS